MFYNANWQLLEERIDTSWPFPLGVASVPDQTDIDKHYQYIGAALHR